jgi:trans-2,3-dihydro-3-hydroxyanthranilate isomerase
VIEFVQVDVFADQPFGGNPLAVFPDPGDLSAEQMQAIAREMNLSETTFVSSASGDAYDLRIFTPGEELPFAGHPTLGTAFVLGELGKVEGDRLTQRTAGGDTSVTRDGDMLWFTRTGTVSDDFDGVAGLAGGLGCPPESLALDASGLGGGRLVPAFSNAGIPQLMTPVVDRATLRGLRPTAAELAPLSHDGIYCFTVVGDDRIEARGFFPALGIHEDPATGSAAAALGLYLAARVGSVDVKVDQGAAVGRPSVISVRAEQGRVEVGGRCHLVLRGRLEALPQV